MDACDSLANTRKEGYVEEHHKKVKNVRLSRNLFGLY